MNREIKFKGRCISSGKWVYGFVCMMPIYKTHDFVCEIVDKWVYSIQIRKENNGLHYRYENIEVDPTTIEVVKG